MEVSDKLQLNDTWVLWYHDPLNTNWDISSYKEISVIDSIDSFWQSYTFIENNIVENSMFFLMRKGINPLWEDKSNVTGGCWSFKIQKGNIIEYWTELSIFLLNEDLIINNKNKSKTNNSNIINGLSISPKKTFCIIKIWNNNSSISNIELLNKSMKIPFDSCIYKKHK